LRRLSCAVVMLFGALLFCSRAYSDVGVVLNDSLDTSVARITGSGHSAVYLSRICPETPVQLRLCGPNEQGSVISNYTTLGEDEPFEWNIVPLNTYLYGVRNAQDRPVFSSVKIKGVLEERYREQVLEDYCVSLSCRTSNSAEWREMVSATSERTLYILAVSTTVQQDLNLIAKFNDRANVNHFNGFARNCADFTRTIINTYFPNATHRNMNDFGVTSPKGIARSFAHYADRHPNDGYYVLHFAQLPGTIKRSSACREGTEQLYHSKKLLVPMVIFAGHELPFVVGSYLLTGRFNPEHEFEQHATIEESELRYEIKQARDEDEAEPRQLQAWTSQANRERDDIVGTAQEWAGFRDQFNSIVQEAIAAGVIPNRAALDHVFKDLDENGKPYFDDHGALWLAVSEDGKTSKVGLTASNLLAPGSDRALAYKIILANINDSLKASDRVRETIGDFAQDWTLLQQAQAHSATLLAAR
jgi:hypothetical protein